MDCLRAQELISDAIDGSTTDPAELAGAKEHCRACAECGGFVRAMLDVQRAGSPSPSEDLVERVMTTVRIEAKRNADAAKRRVPSPLEPTVSVSESAGPQSRSEERPPVRTFGALIARAKEPRYRRKAIAWATAAAVLFIAAGIGAISGVRTILIPREASTETVYDTVGMTAAPETKGEAATSAALGGTGASRLSLEEEASFITVGTTVYRLTGPTTGVELETLQELGTTRSSLDTIGAARSRDVFGVSLAGPVYIEADADTVLAFDRVTRTYGGRLFALQSEAIDEFGVWPPLPQGLSEPTSSSGAPTFEEEGSDDVGTTVYRKRGSSADEGIAVAPEPPAGDPIAGSPSWTWWTPAQ